MDMNEGYDALGRELVALVTQRGLGAIGKRDLEALLLHLFEKHLGWETLSHRELSLRMRLAVSRVKSLRYEGALRFTRNLEAEFRTRLRHVLRQAACSEETKTIEFSVADYPTRFVLEEYLKRRGKVAQWTFTEEGMSAPAATVAALVVDHFDKSERAQALARLKVSDPSRLPSAVEAAFLELMDAAKSSRVKKLADVGGKAVDMGKRGFALAVLLFA
jgi:hypothetical protein